METVGIAYGKGAIPLDLDPAVADWTVLEPAVESAIPDAQEAFAKACRNPIGSPPLADIIRPNDRVVIVTADGTRPVPNSLLIPWLLEELPVPPSQITILIGTGSHRPNTSQELMTMFGRDVVDTVEIVNHDSFDGNENEVVGVAPSGTPIAFNKRYVEADKRIVVGFIEPHFVAGFSGGAKGIAPGIASIDTIFHLYTYELIGHPKSTWGNIDDNPLRDALCDATSLCPPDFMVNVTLNPEKQITGFWCGDYRNAHRTGCRHVRQNAMVPVPHRFPVVVTSNSGYPLDQSIYQSVKGMSAAALIVEDGGTVFMASECSDGVPAHGNFGAVLSEHSNIESIDAWLRNLEEPLLDQWEIQLLIGVLRRCTVRFHSSLDRDVVASCELAPCESIRNDLYEHLERLGERVPVTVLPQGPLTIPYVDMVL